MYWQGTSPGRGRSSLGSVDADTQRAEVRDFLTCRGRITPAEAGLPVYGGLRRVSGLRREDWRCSPGSAWSTTRLERGNLRGVSEAVLEALARALRLSEAERAHLYDLARAANATAGARRAAVPYQVRPGVQRILDAISALALVSNTRMDYLAANRLGRTLYAPLFGPRSASTPAASCCWTRAAPSSTRVGSGGRRRRRADAQLGRPQPFDKVLTDLIGELSTR